MSLRLVILVLATLVTTKGREDGILTRAGTSEVHKHGGIRDELILTPTDYMERRRPTIEDGKEPAKPSPEIYHCKKNLPPSTRVSVSVHISEISMVTNGQVTLSLYLRYSWEDLRLENIDRNTLTNYVEISSSVKDYLWTPDVFLPNAVMVSSPLIFVPSTSFRIYRNYTIFANQYLLIKFACPFNYALFPMDVQICDIALQSFSSTPCELNVTWADYMPLTYSTSKLSQFSYQMYRMTGGKRPRAFQSGSKSPLERSQVHMFVVLSRKIMFYMMQIYIPSILFVFVSWISFLIPAEMAQGRMLLTITTMLTMVSLFAAGSEYVPKASYVKAIDVWMCLCTFLSFFAVVNCLVDIRLETAASGEGQRRAAHTFVLTSQARRQTVVEIFRKYVGRGRTSEDGADPAGGQEGQDSVWRLMTSVFLSMQHATVYIYPVVFVLFNIIYWSVCLGMLEGKIDLEKGVEL